MSPATHQTKATPTVADVHQPSSMGQRRGRRGDEDMPYTMDNPPARTKGMPKHAVEIFVAAFNAALKQYGDEGKAHAVAMNAVKQKYMQDEKGKWVAKDEAEFSDDEFDGRCQWCGYGHISSLRKNAWASCPFCGNPQ